MHLHHVHGCIAFYYGLRDLGRICSTVGFALPQRKTSGMNPPTSLNPHLLFLLRQGLIGTPKIRGVGCVRLFRHRVGPGDDRMDCVSGSITGLCRMQSFCSAVRLSGIWMTGNETLAVRYRQARSLYLQPAGLSRPGIPLPFLLGLLPCRYSIDWKSSRCSLS